MLQGITDFYFQSMDNCLPKSYCIGELKTYTAPSGFSGLWSISYICSLQSQYSVICIVSPLLNDSWLRLRHHCLNYLTPTCAAPTKSFLLPSVKPCANQTVLYVSWASHNLTYIMSTIPFVKQLRMSKIGNDWFILRYNKENSFSVMDWAKIERWMPLLRWKTNLLVRRRAKHINVLQCNMWL